ARWARSPTASRTRAKNVSCAGVCASATTTGCVAGASSTGERGSRARIFPTGCRAGPPGAAPCGPSVVSTAATSAASSSGVERNPGSNVGPSTRSNARATPGTAARRSATSAEASPSVKPHTSSGLAVARSQTAAPPRQMTCPCPPTTSASGPSQRGGRAVTKTTSTPASSAARSADRVPAETLPSERRSVPSRSVATTRGSPGTAAGRPGTDARGPPSGRGTGLPVVRELQRDVEVGALEQRDHGLQVVAGLARDPDLVARDLRLHGLGALVADDLGDLLRVLARQPLLEGRREPVLLAGRLGLLVARVERLEGDAPLDELGLEHVEDREHALRRVRDHDDAVAAPRDRRADVAEVVALRDLLGGLVERVVDLLAVDLADDVERRVGHGWSSLGPGTGAGTHRSRARSGPGREARRARRAQAVDRQHDE